MGHWRGRKRPLLLKALWFFRGGGGGGLSFLGGGPRQFATIVPAFSRLTLGCTTESFAIGPRFALSVCVAVTELARAAVAQPRSIPSLRSLKVRDLFICAALHARCPNEVCSEFRTRLHH